MNKFNIHIAALSLTSSFSAWSLGLGQITVHSYLNQPLLADIELIDVGTMPLSVIRAGLASSEEFERMGLELSNVATMLKFSVIRNSQGVPVIRVQTEERISEPFIEFLMDLASPEGQFYRAYSVLLDPPNYQLVLNQGRVAVKPRHKAAAYDKQVGVVEKEVISHADYAPGDVGITREAATYGPTLANENIWQIAQRYKTPDLLLQQIVLGIVGMNPDAFEMGNLNGLKAGKKLKIPSSKQLMTVPAEQSKLEVLAHDTAWEGKLAVSHVIEPPYMQPLGQQSVTPPVVSQEIQLPSVLEKIPLVKNQKIDLEKMGQYMPNPKDFFTSTTKDLSSQTTTTPSVDAKLGTEMSLAAAAIESVREANALLTEQFKLMQADNKKLKQALGQKDLELKRLAKQIQALSTRQGVAAQATEITGKTSHSALPWLFILMALSGTAGLVYRQLYWQKRMGTQWLGNDAEEPNEAQNAPLNQPPAVRAQEVEIEISQVPVQKPAPTATEDLPAKSSAIDEEKAASLDEVGPQQAYEPKPEHEPESEASLCLESIEDESTSHDASVVEEKAVSMDEPAPTPEPLHFQLEPDADAKEDGHTPQSLATENEPVSVSHLTPLAEEASERLHEPLFEVAPSDEASLAFETEEPLEQPASVVDAPIVEHVIEFEPVLVDKSQPPAPIEAPPASDDHSLEFVLMTDDEQHAPAPVETSIEAPVDGGGALNLDEGDKPLRPKPVKSTQAIETLLALAKTYIVMGDMAAAKESLHEVIRDGEGTYKDEAQKLLDELEGDK